MLKRVTDSNFFEVIKMKVTKEQNRFVAENVVSLAQAWLHYKVARPFAICDGDELVGFLMFYADEEERTVGIWRFMIAPDKQHRGYGRRAMEEAIELSKKAGKYDLMHLGYVEGNTVARELYYSLGFRENGDVDDGEIIMTMRINDNPRVGTTLADEDDIEEIEKLIAAEGWHDVLGDSSVLRQAVEDGAVRRFTLYGDAIGIAYDGELLFSREHSQYLGEAKELFERIKNTPPYEDEAYI